MRAVGDDYEPPLYLGTVRAVATGGPAAFVMFFARDDSINSRAKHTLCLCRLPPMSVLLMCRCDPNDDANSRSRCRDGE